MACEYAWMQPHWDDLKTVLELVRSGSLAGAAGRMGLSYTTVARRVTRIEEALGLTLFERLADGYRPTDEGRLVADHAAQMQGQEDALLRQLAGRSTDLNGPLVVTAPQLLIAHGFAPMLAAFSATYPQVELQIKATNDLLDLTRREADLALRVSRTPGDTLKGLRLSAQDSASFAHRDWAARIADDPNGPIDWILFSGYSAPPKAAAARYPNLRTRYRFDDMMAIAGAVQAGLGAAQMPMFLGRSLPDVVPVPLVPPQPYADIWLVGHRDVWQGAKPTAFRAVIAQEFKAARALFTA